MSFETEVEREVRKLENEIEVIDTELAKLNDKIMQLMRIRKKKHDDLVIIRRTTAVDEDEIQTTLSRLLKEM